ncbi:MAG: hypothetical protein MJA27_27490 [Pseudanabaenales cyanobacterium]|nr:hypothetical protein [Pseudanabaenales cyanobacterium]
MKHYSGVVDNDEGGTSHRETEASIRFDNDESFSWFLAPTPDLNEEFQDLTESTQDLGGGAINIERPPSDFQDPASAELNLPT